MFEGQKRVFFLFQFLTAFVVLLLKEKKVNSICFDPLLRDSLPKKLAFSYMSFHTGDGDQYIKQTNKELEISIYFTYLFEIELPV